MNPSLAFTITNSIPSIYPGNLWQHQGRTLTGRSPRTGESWTLTRIGPNHYKATGATAEGLPRGTAECQEMAEHLASVESRYIRECAESVNFHRANPNACA